VQVPPGTLPEILLTVTEPAELIVASPPIEVGANAVPVCAIGICPGLGAVVFPNPPFAILKGIAAVARPVKAVPPVLVTVIAPSEDIVASPLIVSGAKAVGD